MTTDIILHFEENLTYIAEIFKKRILNRSNINVLFNKEFQAGAYNISLILDENYSKDYKIETIESKTVITGSSFINLVAGMGKVLHNIKFYKDYIIPCSKTGEYKANCEYRCVYFANHFYNYYQLASDESIKTYMEDLALWGYNNIASVLLPVINLFGKDDPHVDWFVQCVRRIYFNAKALGMKYTALSHGNSDFKNQNLSIKAEPHPDPFGSRGHTGYLFCPSKPGATEYIKDLYKWIFEKVALPEIDYFVVWSYDEGGCGCKDCYPWIPGGLMKLYNCLKDDVNARYTNAKYILALWRMADTETEEWEKIFEYLENHPNDFEYVMISTEKKFEKYPLSHRLPRKIIDFTEISMWSVFPWGGFGATVYPNHIRESLLPEMALLSGGMLYSEGISEDINKAVCSSYYFKGNFELKEILEEYISYEFSPDLTAEITELIMQFEKCQHDYAYEDGRIYDRNLAENIKILAQKINEHPSLKKDNPKWRMLFIACQLEPERLAILNKHNMPSVGHLPNSKEFSEEAKNLMAELNQIYEYSGKYTGIESDNHSWVAPLPEG